MAGWDKVIVSRDGATLANQYGVSASYHVCRACGERFYLCPDQGADNPDWDYCMGDECPSYDTERDPFNPLLGGLWILGGPE